jgi:hypothetical protein
MLEILVSSLYFALTVIENIFELFRADSIGTKLLSALFFGDLGKKYLKETLEPIFQALRSSTKEENTIVSIDVTYTFIRSKNEMSYFTMTKNSLERLGKTPCPFFRK